jgi:predicted short-subunit dehydrogenase-like oxidoreductase (DUF2520 family)
LAPVAATVFPALGLAPRVCLLAFALNAFFLAMPPLTLLDNLKYHPEMRESRKPPPSVSIVGAGNWGSSLAHALSSSGVPLREVIVAATNRGSAASHGDGKRGNGKRDLPLITLEHARLEADVLWLCVPDAAIAQVTRRLVERVAARGRQLKGQIVVHSSGALSGQVLSAAAHAGASVASVHPVMSFPTRTPVPLQGVPFGVEADAAGRRVLNSIVRRIGGRPFAINASSKALYHAVGMLSSPLLVSHLAAAQQAATLAGFSTRQARGLIEPIARATLENFFLRGAGKSFSGPIARGDVATIRLHLRALKPHPMLAGVYRSLALYALETLPAPGKQEVRRLLGSK